VNVYLVCAAAGVASIAARAPANRPDVIRLCIVNLFS
jgi:hypothetical protein